MSPHSPQQNEQAVAHTGQVHFVLCPTRNWLRSFLQLLAPDAAHKETNVDYITPALKEKAIPTLSLISRCTDYEYLLYSWIFVILLTV